MAKYIPLEPLVAEIDRRIKVLQNNPYENHKTICHLDSLKQSIDTLEVKEVDLEKEIDNVWNPHFNLGWDDNSLVSINHKSFESIAKYFFELGMAASNKAQEGE